MNIQDKYHYISDEDIAAYLDGNVCEEEVADIFSTLGDNPEVAELLSLSPEIDREVAEEKIRLLPMWALAAANPENLCSFECESFILRQLEYDIDHWSLLEEAKANNWICEEGTPLHHVGKLMELKGLYVERKYDATISDLSQAIGSGKHVIVVIDRNVMDRNMGAKRISYHAIYVTSVENENVKYLNLDTRVEEAIVNDGFRNAWNASGCYMVVASKIANCYNPQPINVADIDLDVSLEELTEAIAENAHDIWARARMDEGWVYGPVRNDSLKQHPDLVPYSQLTDSEKEYDRIMAMNTLRLVRRLGFDIINRK